MMDKVVTIEQALERMRDGMYIMCGGFLGNGLAARLVDAIYAQGFRDLTLIANDSGLAGTGLARLVEGGRCRKLIASYIGGCPETARLMQSGLLEVELVPQGTLAERIRAQGAGLGGILTPTGLGTVVEEGKQKLRIADRDYLLELPLAADLAFLGASLADRAGNLLYHKSTRNFNPLMALAADWVIAEAQEIVETGQIPAEAVMTPGVVVDMVVAGGAC